MKRSLSILVSLFVCFSLFSQVSTWDGSSRAWTRGSGTIDDPYQIASAANLAYLAKTVNGGDGCDGKYFKLMTDIDLNHREWIPIGGTTDGSRSIFSGIFDGNNKTVSNFNIIRPNMKFIGLFGEAWGATLKNILIGGTLNLDGKSYIGAIVGFATDGSIILNCSNEADITVPESETVGGIVGRAYDVTLWKCTNRGNISANNRMGGIVGDLEDATVINCGNEGEISASHSAGGIVGCARDIKIEKCYNTGTVKAERGSVGGIIGGVFSNSLQLPILDSYNLGNISGNEGIGGIMGDHDNSPSLSSLQNCYNVGNISSVRNTTLLGAFIGDSSEDMEITNCYYLDTSISTNNDEPGISQTSDQMQSADFLNLLNNDRPSGPWKAGSIENKYYPMLIISPYAHTQPATDITSNSARLNAAFEKGSEAFLKKGFEYKKKTAARYSVIPTTGNSAKINCEPGNEYLFRTYITTASGTYYGSELSFKTPINTGISSVKADKVLLYPNPATDMLFVHYPLLKSDTPLSIYTAEGKKVEEVILPAESNSYFLDLSHYSTGVYIYMFDGEKGKFIVH